MKLLLLLFFLLLASCKYSAEDNKDCKCDSRHRYLKNTGDAGSLVAVDIQDDTQDKELNAEKKITKDRKLKPIEKELNFLEKEMEEAFYDFKTNR